MVNGSEFLQVQLDKIVKILINFAYLPLHQINSKINEGASSCNNFETK